ncbi:EAL domain-containing protein [Spongiibacter sp.]|uniref:EAL domain-containing response regulator n=1 Tax=Spongiibacter sp. TaxID=2024860 RepID=UPI003566DBCF
MNSDRKILIVDDDAFMRQMLLTISSSVSKHVETADSGEAAIRCFDRDSGRPDIIILDLKMPDIDGVQFARMLSNRNFFGSVILVSGADERILQTTASLIRRQNIDVLGYLHKPVSSTLLQQLLQQWQPTTQSAERSAQLVFTAEDLQLALNRREFFNLYQPKVRLTDGAIAGFESLVRWRHPEHGILSPGDFLTQFATANDLQSLTRQVIDMAFSEAANWQSTKPAPSLAVNVTMEDMRLAEFPSLVRELAEHYCIPAPQVTIEVTESSNIDDSLQAIDTATSLRIMGFSLSIDDFGTGHSTLSQLRDMPFSELKIDRGFVTGASTDDTRRSIFNASLNLANELSMSVVAEGIESESDWAFARRAGCEYGQGYFISQPIMADKIPLWQRDWQRRLSHLVNH